MQCHRVVSPTMSLPPSPAAGGLAKRQGFQQALGALGPRGSWEAFLLSPANLSPTPTREELWVREQAIVKFLCCSGAGCLKVLWLASCVGMKWGRGAGVARGPGGWGLLHSPVPVTISPVGVADT